MNNKTWKKERPAVTHPRHTHIIIWMSRSSTLIPAKASLTRLQAKQSRRLHTTILSMLARQCLIIACTKCPTRMEK